MAIGRGGAISVVVLLLVGCGEGSAERRPASTSVEPGNVAGDVPTSDVSGDLSTPDTVAGGETSEFSGGDVPGCPCGTLRDPLRATITDVGVESVRVRVDELLGNDPGAAVGAEIEGSWYGGLPCYTGRAAVAVGDTVLAFYWPADPGFRGRIALTPWGESVLLAKSTRGELIVSLDELSLLDAPVAECVAGLGNISDYLGPDDNLP
ncbi:MAG: hypothetical protein ABW217_23885 [Polyangiaceae bacterium]